MGIILWKWKFIIAPALISENLGIKNGKKQIKKSWGSFETRRIYTGIRLPLTGDVVNIPDYGSIKRFLNFFQKGMDRPFFKYP